MTAGAGRQGGLERLAGLAGNGTVQRLVDVLAGPRGGPWLAGGAVRDLVLGRRPAGFDVIATTDVLAAGPRLAEALSADYVVTDRRYRHVTLRRDAGVVTLTYLPASESLEENLADRDYTANGMAVDLPGLFRGGPVPLIDGRDGWADIDQGQLRACTWRGVLEHPERVLRGVRFEADTGLVMPSMVRSQVATGEARPLTVHDGEFWDELVGLLGRDDRAVDGRLAELDVARTLVRCVPVHRSGPQILRRLERLAELAKPTSWARDGQRRAIEGLMRRAGVDVRLLVVVGTDDGDLVAAARRCATGGAPAALVARLVGLAEDVDRLRRVEFPWQRPPAGASDVGPAALFRAATALADVAEGARSVPAGPDPEMLVRTALASLLVERS